MKARIGFLLQLELSIWKRGHLEFKVARVQYLKGVKGNSNRDSRSMRRQYILMNFLLFNYSSDFFPVVPWKEVATMTVQWHALAVGLFASICIFTLNQLFSLWQNVQMNYHFCDSIIHLISSLQFPWKEVAIMPVQWHALALGLFASIIAPFGGFFASGFKRAFKVKVLIYSVDLK